MRRQSKSYERCKTKFTYGLESSPKLNPAIILVNNIKTLSKYRYLPFIISELSTIFRIITVREINPKGCTWADVDRFCFNIRLQKPSPLLTLLPSERKPDILDRVCNENSDLYFWSTQGDFKLSHFNKVEIRKDQVKQFLALCTQRQFLLKSSQNNKINKMTTIFY
jgi:hypothetical protein